MDAYPLPYVEHNLPLVLLSGLGQDDDGTHPDGQPRRAESGARIITESPLCHDEKSQQLLREFRAWDGTGCAWNPASLPGPTGSIRYRVKAIGRTYTLPARKAAPLPQSPGAGGTPPPRSAELHSPLSPLSPGSPVFPDGLLTPLWFSKHQRLVPALFIAFFNITNGQSASQDEQLKTDINAIRSAFNRSGYRTRVAVVVISDKSILHAPELEERLASIRKATALDSKTGLFFKPPMPSQVEVSTFVQTTFASLQSSCVDYYRDLAKHSRRKKVRGGPPIQINSPVGGASQSTSTYGWNVRYEVKQGVFAEFRQEMDVAERHYSSAIEDLFSDGGILDTTNSWSPRWNEARLLCDAVALRVLRCLLWTRLTTTAAQSWYNYKLRMKDLVDRRGKGSNTYGWVAWEARWSHVMAQLINKSDLQSLQRSIQDEEGRWSAQNIYAMPEKMPTPGDRFPPFNFLHHSGYFLNLVANGIRSRWSKAHAIPEDDRIPPNQSPASSVANRSKTYDLYLVPDPHEEAPPSGKYDHAAELELVSELAAEEFEARRQPRMSEQTRLELADSLAAAGRHIEASKILTLLWEETVWRESGWQEPFTRLLRLLLGCITRDKTPQNAALKLTIVWELLSIDFVPEDDVDIARSLDDWDIGPRIELHLHEKHRLSPFCPSFAFEDRQGHVGEPIVSQLALTYDTFTSARPLCISKIVFQMGKKRVVIRHDDTIVLPAGTVDIYQTSQARDVEDGTLETSANLVFHAGQTRILHMTSFWKEAQELEVSGLAVHLETPKFALVYEFNGDSVRSSLWWYLQQDDKVGTVLLPHLNTKSVQILPKPPKMKLRLQGLRKQYYTDEKVCIPVEVINDESDLVDATIVAKVVGAAGNDITSRWTDSDENDTERVFHKMEAAATESAELLLQGPPEAESILLMLELTYRLLSDPEAPLTKTINVEIPFIKPFQARFNFTPRLHLDAWPSYFDPDTTFEESNMEHGIHQSWNLGAEITSLVDTSLKIDKMELQVHNIHSEATCAIHNSTTSNNQELAPTEKIHETFELATRKMSLEDRRPSHLELTLLVTWLPPSHDEGGSPGPAKEAVTTISVPRFTIPTSEPRVLCASVSCGANACATIEYHLENPSTHFLTFALTMEANEDFAFSGPKHRALSLAPLSRHAIRYELLLHKEPDKADAGAWVNVNLQVVDSYYQKKLSVHPGGLDMRLDDKSGEISIWIGHRNDMHATNEAAG